MWLGGVLAHQGLRLDLPHRHSSQATAGARARRTMPPSSTYFRTLDLNLLKVFDVVMGGRSAARARLHGDFEARGLDR